MKFKNNIDLFTKSDEKLHSMIRAFMFCHVDIQSSRVTNPDFNFAR
jgi:hypothetical protein